MLRDRVKNHILDHRWEMVSRVRSRDASTPRIGDQRGRNARKRSVRAALAYGRRLSGLLYAKQ